MDRRLWSFVLIVFLPMLAVSALAQESQVEDEVSVDAAQGLLQRGDPAGAAAMLRILVDDDPQNGRAWYLLGLSLHNQGKMEEALKAHLTAATFEQTAVGAMYNAACAYALLENPDQAIEYLQRVKATGKMNLTGIALDADLASLLEDPRLAKLLPTPEEFADPFVQGTRILHEWKGEAQGDQFGWIARNLGDVDGDGINDVITSAPTWGADGSNAGKIYAYSGASGELLWQAEGEAGFQLGLGVEAAGDVNADRIPDAIAGAPGGDRSFVYSGKDGAVLLELSAQQEGENFGRKVSDLGDFDGDGHDDVMVGAPGNDANGEDAGRSYVFSGASGSLLHTLTGENAGDRFGSAGAGVAGDGKALLVIGAPNAGPEHGGRTYVYRGDATEANFIIESDETGANLGGMFVSVVGDVDADGHLDVYASDWSNAALGRSTGRVFIHSGRSGERLLTLTGEGAGDGFGIGPADAGDVNGDGHDDLIVGAWQHAGAAPSGGKVYLYSGSDGELLSAITCQVPGETFGFDATGMGDVDGDGHIDFLLTSAWSAIAGARSGRMFIVSGATLR